MLWWHHSFVSHVCKKKHSWCLSLEFPCTWMHVKQIGMSQQSFLGNRFSRKPICSSATAAEVINLRVATGLFLSLRKEFCPPEVMKPCGSGERERQRNVCFNKHQRCAIDFVSGVLFFFSFLFQEVCYWSPCVCVGMSGFGVHHDRCGGSAHLDGEALHRTSAVHTCPGRRIGTLLLQLLLLLLCEENRSNPNLTVLKGFNSNMRLNVTPMSTREAQSIISEPVLGD